MGTLMIGYNEALVNLFHAFSLTSRIRAALLMSWKYECQDNSLLINSSSNNSVYVCDIDVRSKHE